MSKADKPAKQSGTGFADTIRASGREKGRINRPDTRLHPTKRQSIKSPLATREPSTQDIRHVARRDVQQSLFLPSSMISCRVNNMPHGSTLRRLTFCALFVCAIGMFPSVAAASGTNASFPSRQILILEPFGVGGGPDLLARALAEKLSQILHLSVDVQNVVGQGATAAPSTAAKLPADGYTLLINTNAQAYSRAARTDLNYDPIVDFVPVRTLTEQPYVLVTGRGTGIDSLLSLIAKAKSQPQIVTFGSTGVGTGTHIGGELLNREACLHARHVPPGSTEAFSDIIADMASGKFTNCFPPIRLALPAIHA